MSGYVSQGSELERPHFGSAWMGHDGKPRSAVHLGNATLSFDSIVDAEQTAAAILEAAAAMGKLTAVKPGQGKPADFMPADIPAPEVPR